jgi:carbamoyltransferase
VASAPGRAVNTYYIGLATTFHDPALAIVGPDGDVLYAEATERHLQTKRAINCEPDHLFHTAELIREYCEPKARFVIARSWGPRATRLPLAASLAHLGGFIKPDLLAGPGMEGVSKTLLFERYRLYHLLLCVHSMHLKAGANLALILRRELGCKRLRFVSFEHHLTHAATACYSSPFSEAACMVVDATGERGSISSFSYAEGRIRPIRRHRGSESLGALYMRITELCGFSSYQGEEWKVMGLAPYGRINPEIYGLLRTLVHVEDGGLRYARRGHLLAALRGLESYGRKPGASPLEVADLACTWQRVFAELMDELLTAFHAETGAENLVLCGGCALNSSYAGGIVGNTHFKRLHIPSAPADDGNALGTALLSYERYGPAKRPPPRIPSPYLGSRICPQSLARLVLFGKLAKLQHLPDRIHIEGARLLAEGKVLGWVQGRAEYGPRALGNRSILADPRPATMKDRLNREVKFREEFRPFAPAILHEHGPHYFEDYQESPYMERTLRFRPEVRVRVPAVVHVDGTGRLQTVKREWNPEFHALIEAFYALTGVPLVLNTSFNIMGKPIIHSVEDALAVFLTTGMDALVIGNYLIQK